MLSSHEDYATIQTPWADDLLGETRWHGYGQSDMSSEMSAGNIYKQASLRQLVTLPGLQKEQEISPP